MNKITIKFGTKLKPTKQIVINYNFTLLIVYHCNVIVLQMRMRPLFS